MTDKPTTAAEMGRKGGHVRASRMSQDARTEAARLAGKARAARMTPEELRAFQAKGLAARLKKAAERKKDQKPT